MSGPVSSILFAACRGLNSVLGVTRSLPLDPSHSYRAPPLPGDKSSCKWREAWVSPGPRTNGAAHHLACLVPCSTAHYFTSHGGLLRRDWNDTIFVPWPSNGRDSCCQGLYLALLHHDIHRIKLYEDKTDISKLQIWCFPAVATIKYVIMSRCEIH